MNVISTKVGANNLRKITSKQDNNVAFVIS